MKNASRPRQRSRDSAYATGTEDTTVPTMASTAYSAVLRRSRPNGIAWKTRPKLPKSQGEGQSEPVPAWRWVMNAVRTLIISGSRKQSANAMASACSAIPFSSRRPVGRRRRVRSTVVTGHRPRSARTGATRG
jgi:hypothetical protein